MISSLHIAESSPHLLAIDLGLRFGWSCFQEDGDLVAYGSHHCGQANKLSAVAYRSLSRLPRGSALIVEGNGDLLRVWRRYAQKYEITYLNISAERWRGDCLSTKYLHDGRAAKKRAELIASRLIRARSGRGSTSLRHDAAEACLIGWWGLHHLSWIDEATFQQGIDS